MKEDAHEKEDFDRAGAGVGPIRHKSVDGHTQLCQRSDSVSEPDDVGVCSTYDIFNTGQGSEGHEGDGHGDARLLGADPEGKGEGVYSEEVPVIASVDDANSASYSAANGDTTAFAASLCYSTTDRYCSFLAATGGKARLVQGREFNS